jgi:hypothetical protein
MAREVSRMNAANAATAEYGDADHRRSFQIA